MPRTKTKPKKMGPSFTEHALTEAVGMMTFDPDHTIWKSCENVPDVDGHFIRLQPPSGTAPEEVDEIKQQLLFNGAKAVKILAATYEEVATATEAETNPDLTIRQMVMARAKRTPNVQDLTSLEMLLTDCMDKAGI